MLQHFTHLTQAKLKEQLPVLIKDPRSHQIQGPLPLITWGRGYASVSTPTGLKWVPGKTVKPYLGPPATAPDNTEDGREDNDMEPTSVAWRQRWCKTTGNTNI